VRCGPGGPAAAIIGRAGSGQCRWLPGTVAADDDPADSVAFARDPAEFIRDGRANGTGGRTFRGHGRGGDLRSHDGWMQTCFERSERVLDVPRLRPGRAALRVLPRSAARPGRRSPSAGE
jgi:hypothetical protein